MNAVLKPIDRATPEETAARRERIDARIRAANVKAHQLNEIWAKVRLLCNTEDEAVRGLHAISAGLITTVPEIKSDIYQSVQWIDEVADQIQFRGEA